MVFAFIYFGEEDGGVWLLVMTAFFTQLELNSLLKRMSLPPLEFIGLIIGTAIIPCSYYSKGKIGMEDILAAALVLTVCITLFRRAGTHGVHAKRLPSTFFAILYGPFLIHFYPKILQETAHLQNEVALGFGMFFVLWIVAVSKFSDMGALLVGSSIGRTKMAPTISPGKTVEGLMGGVATATLVGAGLPYFFPACIPAGIEFGPLKACLLSIPIAFVAVIGDLIASVLKRQAGVKDSGSFVPGIGGMLDLMDSLILSAPMGYFLLTFFIL